MTRQYLDCKFRPDDHRSYCYHNDGDALAIGDKAEVETDRGIVTVTIAGIWPSDRTPIFKTKPIVGRAQPGEL